MCTAQWRCYRQSAGREGGSGEESTASNRAARHTGTLTARQGTPVQDLCLFWPGKPVRERRPALRGVWGSQHNLSNE
eukprot:168690-Amphidinium_carterae.1